MKLYNILLETERKMDALFEIEKCIKEAATPEAIDSAKKTLKAKNNLNLWIGDASSMLNRVEYSPRTKKLTAEFKGGEEYVYYNVPPKYIIALISSDSYGKYFYHNVRSNFRFDELE